MRKEAALKAAFFVSLVLGRESMVPKARLSVQSINYFKLKSLPLERFSARRKAAAHPTGKRCGIGSELLNQSKHLGTLRRRKPDERLPQPQTLHGFTGRKPERGTDF